MESVLEIPPDSIRLDNLHRKYSARTITILATHPIRGLLTDSFPGSEKEDQEEGEGTPWNLKGEKYNN